MPISTLQTDLQQTTTVANQFTKSFGSSVQEAAGAVDGFLKAAPTSAGQALSNVTAAAGALGKLGLSAAKSVGAALNQLGSLGNYSKFPDSFAPPRKLTDLKPDEISSRVSFEGEFTYPTDLSSDYYMKLTFKHYERKVPISNPVTLPTITINLPIPNNLQEQFSMSYADKQLGVAGLLENVLPNFNQGAEEAGRQLADNIKKQVEKTGGAEAAFYGARTIAGISDSLGGAVDVATGAVLNPFQTLVFQGVNLRSHSFSYRFSPNNSADQQVLKKIIYELKRRMHPTKRELIYEFPDVVDITFGKKDGDPYFFSTCFLESMSVNYAPQGIPAFFNDGNPVEVEIGLNFKEIKPISRGDFKEPTSPTYYSPY